MTVELIKPNQCVACFVRERPPPNGDLGTVFLTGYVQGVKEHKTPKKMAANFCPHHREIYNSMMTVNFVGFKL